MKVDAAIGGIFGEKGAAGQAKTTAMSIALFPRGEMPYTSAMDSPSPRASPRAGLIPALVLALVAGYVDAFAFLHFQVYASFMSGNTTQTGLQAGLNQLARALWCLTPVPSFIAGVVIGTLLLSAETSVRMLLMVVAGLLAISQIPAAPDFAAVVALSLAMGVMNTTVTRVGGQAISLGYVSGGLNNLGQHIAMAARGASLRDPNHPGDSHARRALLLTTLWAAFLSGAAAAAFLHDAVPESRVAPAITIVVLTAIAFGWISRKPAEHA